MKKLLPIVCVIVMLIAILGYESDEALVGTWYSTLDESICLVFDDMKVKAFDDGVVLGEGYWSQDIYGLDDCYLTIDGQKARYSISGDTLTVSLDGQNITFKKK